MDKFSEICKNYLKWVNFTLGRDTPRHSKMLWTDAIVAMIYSGVSVYLVWHQGTDVIALGLNILCVIRAIISSKLKAYEVVESRNIESGLGKYSHYHNKTIGMCVAAIFSTVIWLILVLNQIKITNASVTDIQILKVFTTIAAIIVLVNDWEDIVIYAYEATVI